MQKNIHKNKSEKPPCFAISNAWAIGYIPSDVIEEVEDILAVMVNKIRLFSYVFTYSGGAHKAIKGHHTFFMNDPEKIGSAMNHLKTEGKLNDVYAMACGRLTPTQRQIARERCSINTSKYVKLVNFLIDNHCGYTDVTRPQNCPQPTFMGFQATSNNTDKEDGYSDSEEHKIETVRFSYSPPNESEENTGAYSNESDFIMSQIKGNKPTMLFWRGGEHEMRKHKLQKDSRIN